jgi:hypothetical protein
MCPNLFWSSRQISARARVGPRGVNFKILNGNPLIVIHHIKGIEKRRKKKKYLRQQPWLELGVEANSPKGWVNGSSFYESYPAVIELH